jgi:hypothetical protein
MHIPSLKKKLNHKKKECSAIKQGKIVKQNINKEMFPK